jgi:nucleotide-binding universal stress UspA family protein
MHMKAILIPTDFSKNAENAMYYGLEFAHRRGCQVILLNVSPFIYHGSSRIDAALEALEQYSKETLKATISKIKESGRYGDLSIKGVNMLGNLVLSILQVSIKHHTELIIMGTKGATGMNKMLFGSNTTEVIRSSKLPVLIVPENAVYKNFEKIIYAIDYKEDNLKMIREMLNIISLFNVKVQSLHIARKNTLEEEIRHRGFINLMEEVFPKAFDSHQLMYHSSVFEGTENFLSGETTSLLAINHHNKPFINSLMLNSLSKEMAYQKQTPFLILNQQELI